MRENTVASDDCTTAADRPRCEAAGPGPEIAGTVVIALVRPHYGAIIRKARRAGRTPRQTLVLVATETLIRRGAGPQNLLTSAQIAAAATERVIFRGAVCECEEWNRLVAYATGLEVASGSKPV